MQPSALLFDLDGTLTEPLLDFPAIKADIGIGDQPILEAIAKMDPAGQKRAMDVLHGHEERAADHSTLNIGCSELLDWIVAREIPMALITRNSRRSAEMVLARHGLKIEVLLTRDEGMFKPDPRPLLVACNKLEVDPYKAWMIGDGQYDIEAGLAAGMKTVWISHGKTREFNAQPWQTVPDLTGLLNLLQTCVSA
ncbi:MAG TPA: HAD-IA family hydrolase [Tepidisphaeraceae bacterium]|nr:HAD-IA family hydrolase [Tepidisphaeraceae bacterium]